jgi:hypothetical protein
MRCIGVKTFAASYHPFSPLKIMQVTPVKTLANCMVYIEITITTTNTAYIRDCNTISWWWVATVFSNAIGVNRWFITISMTLLK